MQRQQRAKAAFCLVAVEILQRSGNNKGIGSSNNQAGNCTWAISSDRASNNRWALRRMDSKQNRRGLPDSKLLSFASPKESNQRKGDPGLPPLRGALAQPQTSGAAQLARSAARPRAQTVLAEHHRSFTSERGGAQGKVGQRRFCVRFAHVSLGVGEAGYARLAGFWVRFLILLPCAPPSSGDRSGDFGEDCLSA